MYLFANVGMGLHAAVCRLFGKCVVMNVDGLDWKRAKWGRVARLYFLTAAHAAMRSCHRHYHRRRSNASLLRRGVRQDTAMIAYGAYVEQSENPALIEQFGVIPDDYYLIASRLIPENHADLIADAFLKSGSRRKLVIAGGANYDSDFHRYLRSLPSDRVILTGHIHDQEVIRELHCNCFAYVHGHSVGGTNPSLLKAMGYGNCILALDTVFNREVLADAGLLFEKNPDSLAALMRQIESAPDLVAELREQGPRRITAEYTWEKVAAQYDELLREVAAKC
jgi:glycosyltransferase involved in cell wall biosynthesis